MTVLQKPGYIKFNGWMVPVELDVEGAASEGWKLHIICRKGDAQTVLDRVCDNVLVPAKVAHKFWPNDDPIANADDVNGGKWFVVYPNSVMQAFSLTAAISRELRALGVLPTYTPVSHEIQVTPYVCTRYGSFMAKAVKAPTGWVRDDRERSHPPHIDNPWKNYISYAWDNGEPSAGVDLSYFELFPTYTNRDMPREHRG